MQGDWCRVTDFCARRRHSNEDSVKQAAFLSLSEAKPLIGTLPTTRDGTLLYHIGTPEGLFWLAYYSALNAPPTLAEGLFWRYKQTPSDISRCRRVTHYPLSVAAALEQLEAEQLVSPASSLKAVDLSHPCARLYQDPSADNLPLNLRIKQEAIFRNIREAWAVEPAQPGGLQSHDPFVLKESAAVTLHPSDELLAVIPKSVQTDLFFSFLARMKPISNDILLEQTLPKGLGIYVDRPPVLTPDEVLQWARTGNSHLADDLSTDPDFYYPPPVEPSFARDDYLVLASETRLLAILKGRLSWWIDDAGVHRLSWQRGGVTAAGLSPGEAKSVAEAGLAWACIRFHQSIEAIARVGGKYLGRENAVRCEILFRKRAWDPAPSPRETATLMFGCADEWHQLGPDQFRGIAGCVTIDWRAET